MSSVQRYRASVSSIHITVSNIAARLYIGSRLVVIGPVGLVPERQPARTRSAKMAIFRRCRESPRWPESWPDRFPRVRKTNLPSRIASNTFFNIAYPHS